jgi:hypothetical protein
MEYFSIRSFRPIETKVDNPDQDRTVLRLCEGLLAVPTGALCSGPQWKPLFGLTDIGAQIETLLEEADDTKSHIVQLQHGSHVFLIVWSMPLGQAIGLFHVAGEPSEIDLDDDENVSLTAPDNAIYRDKNDVAAWYASRIGSRWWLGNGQDDNLQWHEEELTVLGPDSTPDSLYDPSRVRIPPCTSFVMSVTKSIFAAGNAANPMRVWITHPPTVKFPFNEGVYSLDTSFVDLIGTGATRITALSAFQNYVTAHTDAKPVNMFDVDGDQAGWKCSQAPGVANASAPNPACTGDSDGIASFYFGADGEVYKDEAIRTGPYGKSPARQQDIATTRASGVWNREMLRPIPVRKSHVAYDRDNELFWMWAPLLVDGRMALWCFNEDNRSVTGPLRYPAAVASTVMRGMQPALTDNSGIGSDTIGDDFVVD